MVYYLLVAGARPAPPICSSSAIYERGLPKGAPVDGSLHVMQARSSFKEAFHAVLMVVFYTFHVFFSILFRF